MQWRMLLRDLFTLQLVSHMHWDITSLMHISIAVYLMYVMHVLQQHLAVVKREYIVNSSVHAHP